MSEPPEGSQFGCYIHVPFCRARCDYCDFATWTDRSHLVERYLAACRRQILAERDDWPAITSVFVGGGTPSMVPARDLVAVLSVLPLASDAEVTVECNPDDVTPELLRTYVDGAVNRLSFGVQSMVPHVLAALGRTHDPANVVAAADAANSLEIPFNVDLIHGAVGESIADWETSLREAVALGPSHVSAYGLTVEPGTPLAADPARRPDEDDQADKYLIATEHLADAGYSWYEISNWARPRQECRHNLLYWSQGEYGAIGCAAHAHRAGRRWWNLRTPERYIAAVEAGSSPEAASEELPPAESRVEGLQLSLRTRHGVPASAFDAADLAELGNLVDVAEGQATLSVRGRLLANEVALRLKNT